MAFPSWVAPRFSYALTLKDRPCRPELLRPSGGSAFPPWISPRLSHALTLKVPPDFLAMYSTQDAGSCAQRTIVGLSWRPRVLPGPLVGYLGRAFGSRIAIEGLAWRPRVPTGAILGQSRGLLVGSPRDGRLRRGRVEAQQNSENRLRTHPKVGACRGDSPRGARSSKNRETYAQDQSDANHSKNSIGPSLQA